MFIDFFLLNPPKGVLGLDTWGDGKKKQQVITGLYEQGIARVYEKHGRSG